MVEKTRPVLILSIPFGPADRAVVTVVFHSTALRGLDFEVFVPVSFLKEGAFIAQSVATYPITRGLRRLGVLKVDQLNSVEAEVFRWLGARSNEAEDDNNLT